MISNKIKKISILTQIIIGLTVVIVGFLIIVFEPIKINNLEKHLPYTIVFGLMVMFYGIFIINIDIIHKNKEEK